MQNLFRSHSKFVRNSVILSEHIQKSSRTHPEVIHEEDDQEDVNVPDQPGTGWIKIASLASVLVASVAAYWL